MAAEVPHFALPFRFVYERGQVVAAVNEQDSPEEIFDSVHAIVRYPRGFRDDLLDFGITEQVFAEARVDIDKVQAEILEWEPRAREEITHDPASHYMELFDRVRINVWTSEESSNA